MFILMMFRKHVSPVSLLFRGVTLAFALFLSNLLANYMLQRVAWGWPESRQLC
jgi:hypothetical protein